MRGVCVVCVRGACVFGKGTINNLYKIKICILSFCCI